MSATSHINSSSAPHQLTIRAFLWLLAQRGIALTALLVLSPLMLVLYFAVRFSSPGPFLYFQQRPGHLGTPFWAIKVRTMRQGADKNAAFARCVGQDNPQVTKIGRWLRKLKLDELPQLWNIVRGDMVFVGPRPIAYGLHNELNEKIAGFSQRLEMRPGLTNLGQICIDENAEQEFVVDDWRVRFEADMHYFRHQSVSYDLIIIFMTTLYLMRKTLRSSKDSD